MAELFSLSGQDKCGLAWYIDGVTAHDGRFYAMVQVGSTKKVTPKTYLTVEQAQAAGIQLVADTLAELEDLVNA